MCNYIRITILEGRVYRRINFAKKLLLIIIMVGCVQRRILARSFCLAVSGFFSFLRATCAASKRVKKTYQVTNKQSSKQARDQHRQSETILEQTWTACSRYHSANVSREQTTKERAYNTVQGDVIPCNTQDNKHTLREKQIRGDFLQNKPGSDIRRH